MLFLKAFVKSFVFVSAEREDFEPVTLTAYATISYIPKFQIGNETVTIFIVHNVRY